MAGKFITGCVGGGIRDEYVQYSILAVEFCVVAFYN